ncbi:MAG: metallophosphoesterase family protein [Planctomycetes bacterium]|nr:metallophosphoesterase family protein [Planctomycetota bacterium]
MKYAIFSDIHGNLEALEAVMEKLAAEKPDRYICVGDIVGYGADPNECIKKVRAIPGCIIVAGNHDYAAIGTLNNGFFNDFAKSAISWTAKQLNEEEKKFLGGLKLVETLNSISVAHSNLYLPELFEYIQTSYDLQLGFNVMENPVCFIGHSHVPIFFSLQRGSISFNTDPLLKINKSGKFFVNVGSVGQPRDDNPHACYAVYDDTDEAIAIKRVPYDVDKAVSKIRKAGLPEILAERLKYGR